MRISPHEWINTDSVRVKAFLVRVDCCEVKYSPLLPFWHIYCLALCHVTVQHKGLHKMQALKLGLLSL